MALTTLQGTIADSSGQVLTGRLDVRLDGQHVADDTTPDTLYTTFAHQFAIAAGVLDIELPETETARVTYRFRFYRQITADPLEYDINPLFDFRAIVPISAQPYEFGSLVPTGITNDALATGALRVAKTIFADPSLVDQISDALRIYRQDTIPVAPQVGETWIKPSEGTLWRWNSTINRWCSQSVLARGSVRNVSATGQGTADIPILATYTDVLIERATLRWNVISAPNDASNRWSLKAGYKLAANSSSTDLTSDYLTTTAGVAEIASQTVTPNLQLSLNDLELFTFDYTKTGSPGNLSVTATFQYSFLHPTS